MRRGMDFIFIGLSLSSAWGNGHATTYRALLRALSERGHSVLFLERDVPWYRNNRDLDSPEYCELAFYDGLEDLKRWRARLAAAEAVVIGSYVPEGVAVGRWVRSIRRKPIAFYDIDTPITLAKLARGDHEYLAPEQIAEYDIYFSFTGGPLLRYLESHYRSPQAAPLYCSFDPSLYYPEDRIKLYDLGYMGTYSPDRQTPLEDLLVEPARMWPQGKFVVAGPQYPSSVKWPLNVERIEHLPPSEHRSFYNSQRMTLNITREAMIRWGYSPSVRLFEAAACAVPIVSDYWEGLETFLKPGEEILISRTAQETLSHLRNLRESELFRLGHAARDRVMAEHTAAHRAAELEAAIVAACNRREAARLT